ncbi:cytochrome P450 [Trametes elegans]|nr:cytochrome P450 [Trametes elegans]
MLPTPLVATAAVFAWLLWRYLRRSSPLAKIPGPPSSSWLSGHIGNLTARDGHGWLRMLEDVYGSVVRVKGPFGRDWLYVYDNAALYSVYAKDQGCYDEMDWFLAGENYFLGPGVLGVDGETHRKQRRMLHPVFSAKHIRDVTPIFYEVCHRLVDAISARVESGAQDIDITGWMGRTGLELIAKAGIGLSLDPLVEDHFSNPFIAAVKEYLPLFFHSDCAIYHQMISYLRDWGMPSVARWIVDHSPQRTIREIRASAATLHDMSVGIVKQKKAALARGELENQKDIMTILLKANSAADSQDRLPDDQLTAQVSVLLFTATETTSNALSRTLHLLAQNQEVQARLREELIAARDGNDLTYDALLALPYLNAVCKETLRLYAPGPLSYRLAYRDATMPLSQPIRGTDGSSIGSIYVPKNTVIVISNLAYNRNKEVWGEDADQWKPERWMDPLPRVLEESPSPGIWSRMMTFAGGPRSCVGFQFALLEMKVVLSLLIANFTFEESADKPVFWNHSGVMYPSIEQNSTRAEMWLKVKKYNEAEPA